MINNAGVSQFALTAQQDYPHQIELNLLVPMQLCQMLLPQLQQRPEAVIVNVGSAFGSIGYPGFSGYCASKFGLRGFTEALKRELAASQVRVLYFAPRATDTSINSAAVVEMNQQLGTRMDSPDFVAAQLLAQLKSSQSRGVFSAGRSNYLSGSMLCFRPSSTKHCVASWRLLLNLPVSNPE